MKERKRGGEGPPNKCGERGGRKEGKRKKKKKEEEQREIRLLGGLLLCLRSSPTGKKGREGKVREVGVSLVRCLIAPLSPRVREKERFHTHTNK